MRDFFRAIPGAIGAFIFGLVLVLMAKGVFIMIFGT
jgi:hypothetical protein